jgi:hypothetical protein
MISHEQALARSILKELPREKIHLSQGLKKSTINFTPKEKDK